MSAPRPDPDQAGASDVAITGPPPPATAEIYIIDDPASTPLPYPDVRGQWSPEMIARWEAATGARPGGVAGLYRMSRPTDRDLADALARMQSWGPGRVRLSQFRSPGVRRDGGMRADPAEFARRSLAEGLVAIRPGDDNVRSSVIAGDVSRRILAGEAQTGNFPVPPGALPPVVPIDSAGQYRQGPAPVVPIDLVRPSVPWSKNAGVTPLADLASLRDRMQQYRAGSFSIPSDSQEALEIAEYVRRSGYPISDAQARILMDLAAGPEDPAMPAADPPTPAPIDPTPSAADPPPTTPGQGETGRTSRAERITSATRHLLMVNRRRALRLATSLVGDDWPNSHLLPLFANPPQETPEALDEEFRLINRAAYAGIQQTAYNNEPPPAWVELQALLERAQRIACWAESLDPLPPTADPSSPAQAPPDPAGSVAMFRRSRFGEVGIPAARTLWAGWQRSDHGPAIPSTRNLPIDVRRHALTLAMSIAGLNSWRETSLAPLFADPPRETAVALDAEDRIIREAVRIGTDRAARHDISPTWAELRAILENARPGRPSAAAPGDRDFAGPILRGWLSAPEFTHVRNRYFGRIDDFAAAAVSGVGLDLHERACFALRLALHLTGHHNSALPPFATAILDGNRATDEDFAAFHRLATAAHNRLVPESPGAPADRYGWQDLLAAWDLAGRPFTAPPAGPTTPDMRHLFPSLSDPIYQADVVSGRRVTARARRSFALRVAFQLCGVRETPPPESLSDDFRALIYGDPGIPYPPLTTDTENNLYCSALGYVLPGRQVPDFVGWLNFLELWDRAGRRLQAAPTDVETDVVLVQLEQRRRAIRRALGVLGWREVNAHLDVQMVLNDQTPPLDPSCAEQTLFREALGVLGRTGLLDVECNYHTFIATIQNSTEADRHRQIREAVSTTRPADVDGASDHHSRRAAIHRAMRALNLSRSQVGSTVRNILLFGPEQVNFQPYPEEVDLYRRAICLAVGALDDGPFTWHRVLAVVPPGVAASPPRETSSQWAAGPSWPEMRRAAAQINRATDAALADPPQATFADYRSRPPGGKDQPLSRPIGWVPRGDVHPAADATLPERPDPATLKALLRDGWIAPIVVDRELAIVHGLDLWVASDHHAVWDLTAGYVPIVQLDRLASDPEPSRTPSRPRRRRRAPGRRARPAATDSRNSR